MADDDFNVTDWTEESHGNDIDGNVAEVFDDMQIKRLDLVITPERWQLMLDDMSATYGEFGSSAGGARGPQGGRPDSGTSTILETAEDPIFVPAEVFYNGMQWYRVGVRFKGNSSLQSSWQSGNLKLSFKLDFDEYEDDYPQIDNQRFYGFKKFSLKNNYDDRSMLREKVASDVFRDFGVPVSHTAFYTLYVDYGNGAEYFGVYTLVEEVDGNVLDTQFMSDDGNLYKPEEGSANFVEGSFDEIDFTKKTNEDNEDWTDVISMFDALHADTFLLSPALWRENLESVFDVDGYLKYLAVNAVIQNWDTYGLMPHNYYLYNDPETNKLTWIPWDNNEALQEGKRGGALALDFSNLVASEWPLIARIYSDNVYKERYDTYLAEVTSNAFEPATMQSSYDSYSALIAPFATTERQGFSFLQTGDDFYSAVEQLKTHVSSRASAVEAYLSNP
ncbi:MAG: CotH kinase family protein [Granulosicoccus sp.]